MPPQRNLSDQYFSLNWLIVTPFEEEACMNLWESKNIPTWFVCPPALLLKNTKSPSFRLLKDLVVLHAFSMSCERLGNFIP